MLSIRVTYWIQRSKQIESKMTKKALPCKQKPRGSWHGYTNVRQIDYKTKINTRDQKPCQYIKKILIIYDD